ncbi:copper homeostasis membrane protein CopD [Caulobacter mirabilis]|uniref:Copper resistance protein CopD n=1 Tax=Caulobacter mirabilis TaxID=69666 RepID=A0A2D2B0R7_9CAUL|nr:copper homeostasis membrane protein CopD [Caulobacter mirabilis]ATQ43852.1 copper resistance protein CopD [Caulobacter mirabilis]
MSPEAAVIPLRLLQYLGGAVLLGLPLFMLFSGASARWAVRWIAVSAGLTLASGAFALIAQTALMAGSWSAGLTGEALGFVAGGTGLGRAGVVRMAAAALALAVLALAPRRWGVLAGLGGVVCAGFAWMGHGAATEGPGGGVHLASDILHSLAAAVWIGALVGFLGLLYTTRPDNDDARLAMLHRALERFSGVGTAAVAVIVGTGLVNGLFLVGLDRLPGLWTTPYGGLLLAKLALFAAMLALAAKNRFTLTPALGAALEGGVSPAPVLDRLKSSLWLETGAAVAVLALVAWLGTLAPISSM